MALKVPDYTEKYCGERIFEPKRYQLGKAVDLAAYHADKEAIRVLFDHALETREHSQKKLIKWSNLVYYTRLHVLRSVDEEAKCRECAVLPLLDEHLNCIANRIDALCSKRNETRIPLTIKDYSERYMGRFEADSCNFFTRMSLLLDEVVCNKDEEGVQTLCAVGFARSQGVRSDLCKWWDVVLDARKVAPNEPICRLLDQHAALIHRSLGF